MCGIVGIVGRTPVTQRLVRGLKRLEYRGYDSAGVAVLNGAGLERRRAAGKIVALESTLADRPVDGVIGVGHTRWATHGAPTQTNAHPHAAGRVAVVHNGIIENHRALRAALEAQGRIFETDTDTEVAAHLIDVNLANGRDVDAAVFDAFDALEGAYAIAAMIEGEEGALFAARQGSPLAAGVEGGEGFLGSDGVALAPFADSIVYLEDGDRAIVRHDAVETFAAGRRVARPIHKVSGAVALAEKGAYRHFMLKEIHEQPESATHTLSAYLNSVAETVTPPEGLDFSAIDRVTLVACGTASYASMIAKYWFEGIAGLPADVDIGSEFRYRQPALSPKGLAIAITQSGETADTRAAFELCRDQGLATAAIVNVPESTIARMADAALLTHAGPEIGVASTKAFTAQLCALASLAISAGRARGAIDADQERARVRALLETPRRLQEALDTESELRALASRLAKARDVLYLGRGALYPLALEAALKLKEISYIHAEGYAAGELKHGPIALVDETTPIVVVAPTDPLFDKTMSSMEEVSARGGRVILVTDALGAERAGTRADTVIVGPTVDPFIAPIVYAVPLQLMAYYTAVEKGTDVDQPRNLAKSVTVE